MGSASVPQTKKPRSRRNSRPLSRAGRLAHTFFDYIFDVVCGCAHGIVLLFAADDFLRLDCLVSSAALGVKKAEKLFQCSSVC
jgi:hypothetical protein